MSRQPSSACSASRLFGKTFVFGISASAPLSGQLFELAQRFFKSMHCRLERIFFCQIDARDLQQLDRDRRCPPERKKFL